MVVNNAQNKKHIVGKHYLHELPQEDEVRLEALFKSLDLDGNGRIDILDLSEALKDFGVHHKYAQKFIEQSDQNKSGDISLAEFIHYVREHEKNLRLQFSSLDKNKDGKIDVDELIKAFRELGVDIDATEATSLLLRMDQDGSLNISFDEWRDYLLYAPSTDIIDLISYWRHSTYMDTGDNLNVPDDFTKKEMITGMWWRHLVAGGVAGGVSRTCTAPLDRLKVHLQVHGNKHSTLKKCLKDMIREGGIFGMWRGNGVNCLKIAPESAIKFMAYEQVKRVIKKNQDRELSIYERFVAGSAAGGISQTVIYPLEVLKTRLALRTTGQYNGISHCARYIFGREGVKAFYRGYIPNLLGIIPYAGTDLAIYESLKNYYMKNHGNSESPNVLLLLACGTASSTCGQLCSYPLALVRTRLQAQGTTSSATMSSLFREIVNKEGLVGLYRGLTPNFVKVIPAVSISYVVYEKCRQALGVNMT